MSMNDPISDLLTRIRNGQKARKVSVSLPASKVKLAIAEVLEREGYVSGVSTEEDGVKKTMTVELKYYENEPVIERIERVSRPGLRLYVSTDKLPKVQGGLGVAIISTSSGVMTDREARATRRGGEVLCVIS
ncbi:30S ribosomal protein S8 [Candidatus Rariloculus sp.]|uniref:30S ribosomal protein S8 n=1 Tax=Candidatus Rariloculus sp. TaxID=3101265 RepID=UPI003D0F050A